jgi:hypothetical protein
MGPIANVGAVEKRNYLDTGGNLTQAVQPKIDNYID